MLEAAPVPRTSTVDTCADAIRRAIVQGELDIGSRLPPERALATQFAVNRVTVRSALARLAREGLLSVRQGSGYVVQDFRRQAGPDLISEIAALATARGRLAVIEDLLLVRRHLARAVLEKLEGGVSEKARARIGAAIDHLEALTDKGATTTELAEADAEVLARIVEASGSAVLQLCLNPVLAISRSMPDLREAIYADARESVQAFRALVAWLESGRREGIDSIVEALGARDARTLAHFSSARRKSR
jgi:DNA-binding FadR family transcriptional regulator